MFPFCFKEAVASIISIHPNPHPKIHGDLSEDYFEVSANVDPNGSHAGRQFGKFLDRKLTEEVAWQGSVSHAATLKSRQLTEASIKRIDMELEKLQRSKFQNAKVQQEIQVGTGCCFFLCVGEGKVVVFGSC